MNRELAIIIRFFIVVVSVTASDYGGLSFQLTRLANDKFQNPTAKVCNWEAKYKKFCIDTNSRCDGNCCKCTCDYQTSTFDRSTMECRNNDVLRSGCKAKFDGQYTGAQVQVLDLSNKGENTVYWPVNFWNDKVKSFNILNITSHHDGREVNTKFLVKKRKPTKRTDGNWQSVIQWNPVSKENYGKLFKVSISYEIERTVQGGTITLKRNDCFVFKSSGSITVTFPRPILTTSPPSIADRSTTTSSPITTLPNTTPKTTKQSSQNTPFTQISGEPTDSVDLPITSNKMTKSTSSVTTQTRESKKTRKPTEPVDNIDEQSSSGEKKEGGAGGGGSNVMTVSLAVVGCIVLLVLVVLLVLWTRKRAAKASKKKNGGLGVADADGSVDNPIESIYAEADNSMNYPKKDKNNLEYDYVNGNLDNNYTSLDMNKMESKPTYESLINTQNSMYEQIPANYNTSGVSGLGGGIPIAEPLYHAVDTPGGGHDPGQMYHEPDDYRREISGRTGVDNPERVYSTLEEESSPENYCREVPGRTGDDYPGRVYSTLEEEGSPENYCPEVPGRTDDENPERVYSVLEDDTRESDYLAVMPDYEQPINPPMPDA